MTTTHAPPTVSTEAVVTAAAPAARRFSIGRAIAWASLVAIVLITLVPFFWMLRTALSSNGALSADPGSLLPVGFTLDAFRRVLGLTSLEDNLAQGGAGSTINFWLYLRNSVVTSTIIAVFQVSFSAMAAYAFSRLRWRGREAVFAVFLSALMVPGIFTAIPNFVLVKDLGLLNTYAGIVLPSVLMTPFAIFFLRQFFLGIPREVEEAALIDGAGRVRCFTGVIVPMSVAPIAMLAVLTYITAWNEYLWPLLVAQSDDVRVLTVAIGIFRQQAPVGTPDWSGLMAATLIAALPIMVLFCVFGRRIVNSIGFSGIK